MSEQESVREDPIAELDLSPKVQQALRNIQAEINDAYRENFFAMTQTMNQLVSGMNRIQTSLNVLIEHLVPTLAGKGVPVGLAIAADGEAADVAKTLAVADPIGMGFTLSQSDLARGLKLSQADVSVLVRAFKLNEDEKCAVVVRRGKDGKDQMVNYHPRVAERFKELVSAPPKGLSQAQQRALKRVKEQLNP
jgi:hypothetical protein